MSNPYAPPSIQEDALETRSNKGTILRSIGALALSYHVVRILLRPFPTIFGIPLESAMIMALFIYGFLRGGKKFHLSIALFMALSIAVQVYFGSRAIAHPERLPFPMDPHPWRQLVIAEVPFAIALACASLLYLGARRASGPAH
ncbi:hypothetical protein [Luteolibacter soli]|uniref:Transmembrane protein n=1 Tax=Luteolibacter soli TaxID=3135280 RepID=A0ABU9AVH7_9BACT